MREKINVPSSVTITEHCEVCRNDYQARPDAGDTADRRMETRSFEENWKVAKTHINAIAYRGSSS